MAKTQVDRRRDFNGEHFWIESKPFPFNPRLGKPLVEPFLSEERSVKSPKQNHFFAAFQAQALHPRLWVLGATDLDETGISTLGDVRFSGHESSLAA